MQNWNSKEVTSSICLKINCTSLDLPLYKPCPETLFRLVASRRKPFMLPVYNLVGGTKIMLFFWFIVSIFRKLQEAIPGGFCRNAI